MTVPDQPATLDDPPPEAPVLVVVLNDPADLERARVDGWYRIPLSSAPRRVAADYLAFYQTGAFPPEERWAVRWLAPIRGYYVAARLELIPGEPDHPRARERYHKITLGRLVALPRPIPSRRLRRITFIPTTIGRLYEAQEINDLWLKSSAQERLWAALKQADIEAERQYPLQEDFPDHVADFALLCGAGRIALLVEDEPPDELRLRDTAGPAPEYLLAAGEWRVLRAIRAELDADTMGWVSRVAKLVSDLGGIR
jgi:hypothetical protein